MPTRQGKGIVIDMYVEREKEEEDDRKRLEEGKEGRKVRLVIPSNNQTGKGKKRKKERAENE